MRKALAAVALTLLLATAAHAWELQIWNEFARFTPDGQLIKHDWTSQPPEPLNVITRPNRIQAVRNGYISLVLLVKDPRGGPFKLSAAQTEGTPVQIDLFRAWYHFSKNKPETPPGQDPAPWLAYVPDALVPIHSGAEMALPMPDNRIPDQKAQMFWLDLFIPKDAKPGQVTIKVTLNTQGFNSEAYAILDVLPVAYPDEDTISADHNSYGMGFVSGQYPQLRDRIGANFSTSDEAFALVREYYKLHYEHHGTFHNLGYGHNGAVAEQYAPELGGFGESRRPVNWDLFERHFGPLLDGSAFKDTRRGARPVEYLYLTINPEWPARYVLFGTQGYETEFVTAVRDMIRHFEDKGWTNTKFEMFFNHKKRYKGFEWDGDETRWLRDDVYFKLYKRLLAQATPRNSKVQVVFRHDASWRMHEQWQSLNGVIDMWVCGGGMFSWFPWAPKMLHDRGNIVWIYGGTPTAWAPIIQTVEFPARTWMFGIDGYCRWLTTDPGGDPWFDFGGAGTAMVYSGERFGLTRPIPCIRLKIERNAVQDVNLLDLVSKKPNVTAEGARISVAAMAKSKVEDWWNPTPQWIHQSAMTWSNASLDEGIRPSIFERNKLDPNWWMLVRQATIETSLTSDAPDHEGHFHGGGAHTEGHQEQTPSQPRQEQEHPHDH